MVTRAIGVTKQNMLEETSAIITTLGENGSVVTTLEGEYVIPAVIPDKVSDPTGAGDAFRAGLIKGLVTGKTLVEAARMGTVSASFGVECQGTQCHKFTVQDFWKRHHRTFGNVQ
jgi:adenosine kinase